MTTLIEVDIAKIDEKIAKVEAELAMLKMARSFVAEQAKSPSNPANSSEVTIDESWYLSVPGLFSEGSLTMKQIWQGLRAQGNDVSYGSVYQWMKRAVIRGEYAKRGKKYKLASGGSPDA